MSMIFAFAVEKLRLTFGGRVGERKDYGQTMSLDDYYARRGDNQEDDEEQN